MAQQSTFAEPDRYAKAGYNRKGVWRTAIIAVIALIVFVGIVIAIDALLKPQLSGLGLWVVGLVLALVPAGLWLTFFYVQDRVEPEPVGHVARVFVIGLALAGAVGIPLTNAVLKVPEWLFRDGISTLAGAVLIAAVEAFIIYAAVRYFIFDSPEFDERTDGVIYGTAAALGYATALNLQFIVNSGGSGLGGTEMYVAEVALAYAAFGGVIGYFLGHAKLDRDPVWWLPLGYIITVLLGGLFIILRGQLDTSSLSAAVNAGLPSFSGLVLAGVLVIAVTAVVAWLVNRDTTRTETGAHAEVVGDPTVGDKQANYAVIGVFAVLLILGVIAYSLIVNGVTAFNKGGVSGAYPNYYGNVGDSAMTVHVADKVGTGAEFMVATRELKEGQDMRMLTSLMASERGSGNMVYKVLDSQPAVVNGKQAQRVEFAYVDSGGFSGATPRVIQGTDYIFMQGSKAVVATMLAAPDTVGEVEPLFMNFINSLTF